MRMSTFQKTLRIIVITVATLTILSSLATLLNFPYNTDPEANPATEGSSKLFYSEIYKPPAAPAPADAMPVPGSDEGEAVYMRGARASALSSRVPEKVKSFVEIHELKGKRVLEIGSGSGLLQDIVDDYTGLDISGSVRRFYHKPFVEASATAIPFPDNTFDAAWSIWVLEHISNPERALKEMRRVVRDNGYIFLLPAWESRTWFAEGYNVRPYSDLDMMGKLTKASLLFRDSKVNRLLYRRQIQAARWISVQLSGGPSRLHYIRLKPNYSKLWQSDSDAAVSVSFHEVGLWFKSRGDLCNNCPSEIQMASWIAAPDEMIVRVRKGKYNSPLPLQ
jgi:SAM-dependent methyltransferase